MNQLAAQPQMSQTHQWAVTYQSLASEIAKQKVLAFEMAAMVCSSRVELRRLAKTLMRIAALGACCLKRIWQGPWRKL
jgi:hypothetical protein